MILLTDSELLDAFERVTGENSRAGLPGIAKAQIKKLYDWGNEICSNSHHNNLRDEYLRRHCKKCWEELNQESQEG